MLKLIRSQLVVLVTVGFFAYGSSAEAVLPPLSVEKCENRKQHIQTSYDETVASYQQTTEERAARAETLSDKKLSVVEAKAAELTANAEQRFLACVKRTNDELRCLAQKDKALARIADFVQKSSAKIQVKLARILARLENWYDKKAGAAEKRLNNALEKLEARCNEVIPSEE